MSTVSCDLTHVDLIDTWIVWLKEQLVHDCLTRIGLAVTCDEKTAILTSCNIKILTSFFTSRILFHLPFTAFETFQSLLEPILFIFVVGLLPATSFLPHLFIFWEHRWKEKHVCGFGRRKKNGVHRSQHALRQPWWRKKGCFSYSVNLWRHRHGGRGTTNVILRKRREIQY